MNAASQIYELVAGQWDDTCGGGGARIFSCCTWITLILTPVWWSSAKTYKNAITNELFLLTSAQGYSRTKDAKYLQNAKNVCDCSSFLIRV